MQMIMQIISKANTSVLIYPEIIFGLDYVLYKYNRDVSKEFVGFPYVCVKTAEIYQKKKPIAFYQPAICFHEISDNSF